MGNSNISYGPSGRPTQGQFDMIRNHFANVQGRQATPNTAGPVQTAQAPGTAPGPAPFQGGPSQAQQAQMPQALQGPQVAQQAPQQFQRQMQQQIPQGMQQVQAQPQPQQQAQHPAQQQAQGQADFVQSMIATQQAELAALKAQVAAFEAAKGSRSTQDRIAERIEKDEFLNNEDNLDPDARAARVAQISFEELQRANTIPRADIQRSNESTPMQQADPILQELIMERKIQGQLGLVLSGPQLQKVAEIANQIGGDSNRALVIASTENPELFGGNAGFQDGPGGQGMLTPQGGYSMNRQEPTMESTRAQRYQAAREGGRVGVDNFVRSELAGRLGRFFPGLAQG